MVVGELTLEERDGIGERTIAENVYVRLFPAKASKVFIETKALKRRSVNIASGSST